MKITIRTMWTIDSTVPADSSLFPRRLPRSLVHALMYLNYALMR
jgi:hypothetical protein